MEFKSELDVYKFIMELETYVFESTPIPFSNKVIVDKDIIYDYLDRLRSRLPREMKKNMRIFEEKSNDFGKIQNEPNLLIEEIQAEPKNTSEEARYEQERILKEAEKERERILREAQSERNRILLEGEKEAQNIINNAQKQISSLIKDSEAYQLTEKECAQMKKQAEEYSIQIIEEAYSYVDQIMEEIQEKTKVNLKAVKDGRLEIREITNKLSKKRLT